MNTIDAFSSIDGQLLKSYPVSTQENITESIISARSTAKLWADKSVIQRLAYLSPLKQKIVRDIDAITEKIVVVTGKVKTEALLGEIYPLMEMLRYYEKNADKILAQQAVSTSPFAFPNARAHYQYHPFGVVAVISPWNFPFQLTLYPLLSALIAGNAVIFKTSELSLPIGELIMQLMAELELPDGLVQWVVGGPESGRCLIEQRPDLVLFTGGHKAGCSIMATAAQHPIPVILELGGKDAMLVFADAQKDRAINAVMYGAFSNSGQVCISVEQLYIEQKIFNLFVDQLCQALKNLKVGLGDEADLGAITSKTQLAKIEAHYQDAIAKGARASGPLTIKGSYVTPVILWNMTDDMRMMQEETFGPLLAVISFDDETEVVSRINNSQFGLNASVWSQHISRAERVANQLKVGNWVVNDVIKNIGHPRLPFGGVKNSGFGRYHGAEGLRSFCYTVSGLVSHSRFIKEPNWFPYSNNSYQAMRAFVDTLFASDSFWRRLQRNWRELRYFQQYSGFNLVQHGHNFLIFILRKLN
jgi:acyl-CoA reductase-like NAD-dependent aldehyde dehydrogenase